MFADAYELATKFTVPVVMAIHRPDGKCGAMMGAAVFLNKDGWALTAWHVVKDMLDATQQAERNRQRVADTAAVNADTAMSERDRRRRLKEIGKPVPSEPDDVFVLFGQRGATPGQYYALEAVDLAVVKVDGFNPALVPEYPKIKDPNKPMRIGTSLCKLGFPFHAVQPSYNGTTRTFDFASGSFPIPFFPIDGILTRIGQNPVPGATHPLKWVETSSAGLKGQSGGPIIDSTGTIWAIQSSTNVLDTGFDPKGPDGKNIRQFFSVGLGVHAETICSFLRAQGISFELSSH